MSQKGHLQTYASKQIASYSITSLALRIGLNRGSQLSEVPQSTASRLNTRP
jgi:hypothetical protein